MEHLLLKAATTATTDQGEFTAIAAAYSVDRVKDRIVPGAFAGTIKRWQDSGKQIPLHWNHEGDPQSIIGAVDPASMRETDQGLLVKGKLDLADSEIAREAWRSMKNGSMSLSFGYVVDKSRKAANGVTDLLAIDLFEISIVPAPANADTRVLSLKQMADAPPTADQMRILNSMIGQAQEYIASDPDPEDASEMAEIIDVLEELRGEPDTEDPADDYTKAWRALKHELKRQNVFAGLTAGVNAEAVRALADVISGQIDCMKSAPEDGHRSVDSLRQKAQRVALDIRSDGLAGKPPPAKQAPQPKQRPEMDPDELRKHSRDLMIQILSGVSDE